MKMNIMWKSSVKVSYGLMKFRVIISKSFSFEKIIEGYSNYDATTIVDAKVFYEWIKQALRIYMFSSLPVRKTR